MRGFLFALLLVSCAPHEDDYTPLIHVAPNAAARASWLVWPSGKNLPPPAPTQEQPTEEEEETSQDEAPQDVPTK